MLRQHIGTVQWDMMYDSAHEFLVQTKNCKTTGKVPSNYTLGGGGAAVGKNFFVAREGGGVNTGHGGGGGAGGGV